MTTPLRDALLRVIAASGDCGTMNPSECRVNNGKQCARCIAREAVSRRERKWKIGDSVEFVFKKTHRYGIIAETYDNNRYGIRDSEGNIVNRAGSALIDGPPLSPLFPELFACDIGSMKVYRVADGRRKFVPSSGFEFDPYETTEDDVSKHFGSGVFYLAPHDRNHRALEGCTIVIDVSVGPDAPKEV